MLKFYEGFLQKHPEFKGRPVYVAGESFGGHTVPYTASALKYSGNKDINVKGFFISSGAISEENVFSSYLEFALLNKQYTKITQQEYLELSKKRDVCVYLLNQGPNNLYQYNGFLTCEGPYYINFLMTTTKKNKNFNPYYMPGDFPTDFSFPKFLNRRGVKKYLKVRKQNYSLINKTVFLNVGSRDFRQDVTHLVSQLLDDGVKGVIVDDTLDFICNYHQSEKTIDELNWSSKQGWSQAQRKPCKYGLCKEYRNLKQIRIPGAGHGISIYKPEFGLEIRNTLMFGDGE